MVQGPQLLVHAAIAIVALVVLIARYKLNPFVTLVIVSLAPAYTQCTNPNRRHGPPLAFDSCNPPEQSSSRLTVGTFDANGTPPNFVGSVTFRVAVGDPDTPANEADVRVAASLADVRTHHTLRSSAENKFQSTM